jgi:hypothetical protein
LEFFPQDLSLEIPSLNQNVRYSEYSIKDSRACFYLLPSRSLNENEAEVLQKDISEQLRLRIPSKFSFEVRFFVVLPLEIILEGTSGSVSECQLALEEFLQPFPLGAVSVGEIISVDDISNILWRRNIKTKKARFLIGETGELRERIERKCGEKFSLRVTCYG